MMSSHIIYYAPIVYQNVIVFDSLLNRGLEHVE